MKAYKHVQNLWDETVASRLDPVGRLIYRSNLLGSDQRITNTGGGNTSSKVMERDPLTGEPVEVLWVKGSGGDLRTSTKENFSSLYQSKLMALQNIYGATAVRGPKTPAEDAMVGMYNHCTFNLNPRPSSIDTPLHSFVPAKIVDHMHPNAVIAIAASRNSRELTQKIYGDEIIWLPWQRPGFDLGLQLQAVCRQHPQAKGVLLSQHGIINWANSDRECYELSLDLIERAAVYIAQHDKGAQTFGGPKYQPQDSARRRATFAAILPWLRGQISQPRRFVGTVQDDELILQYVNSVDAQRLTELGTSCPDHFLRTKIKGLYVDWNPQSGDVATLQTKLAAGLTKYRQDYADYYNRWKRPDSPAMRDPNPTVVLIPGLGLIAWGKDKSESRVTAEFCGCAVDVIRGAEAVGEYIALPQQEAFEIEYWQLEEAKLRRQPPEKELARQIIAVIGAGSGIGREVAHRVVKEGAQVVCVDRNAATAQATAKEITDKIGLGVGVAGSGISSCGPAIGLAANIADRASIRAMLNETVLAYGGLDSIIITAGITYPSDNTGHIPDEQWGIVFSINVTGAYLVGDEARKLWEQQGLTGNLVLTTSVNAVVAKPGMIAYDTSKAAANHLVRGLAVELAPLIRVNGVAPATVVAGSSMFPRERVISSLTKYRIVFAADESDDDLRAKLSQFYAQRTLTKQAILPADQAEAIFLLVSQRLAKTTGQILTVDGGLPEAFLR